MSSLSSPIVRNIIVSLSTVGILRSASKSFKEFHRPSVTATVQRVWWSSSSPSSSRVSSGLGVVPSAVGYNDYEAERRTFRLQQPEFYNFASDVIDRWAVLEQSSSVKKNTPAFWWVNEQGDEIRWTFKDLSDRSRRIANMLVGPCRLSPGDGVVVLLPKIPEWWLINIACARAGVVIIPGATQLSSKDIQLRIDDSQAKCVIADSSCAEKVDEIVANCPSVVTKVIVKETRPGWYLFEDLYSYCSNDFQTVQTRSEDAMILFFTSGTTGQPKMTKHSFTSYALGHTGTARHWMDLTPTDTSWTFSDTGWAKSAWGLFAPWINGACIFVHSMPRLEPELVLKTLEKYPVSTLCCPATGFRMLIRASPSRYKFGSLRHCFSGGEPVNPRVVEDWLDETGMAIREGYGQSETVMLCCTPRCLPVKLGSIGKAAPGIDLTIVDSEGHEVGPNVEGEIAVRVKPNRPVGLFTEYHNDPERTASSFRGHFYVTGDLARQDENGYFWFSSRSDDIIISSGYRIGPSEVEGILMEHAAVEDAAVVSSPDELRGEVVKAFVMLSTEYQQYDQKLLTEQLQAHVRQMTAPYKYPRKVEYVKSLPKTVSGKTRRVELRKQEWKKQ